MRSRGYCFGELARWKRPARIIAVADDVASKLAVCDDVVMYSRR